MRYKFLLCIFLILIQLCGCAQHAEKEIIVQYVPVEELGRYMSIDNIQDGVLYGMVQTESGYQWATYDASSNVAIHGKRLRRGLYGEPWSCFSGENGETLYGIESYITDNGFDAYMYALSPSRTIEYIKIGHSNSIFYFPQSVDNCVFYLHRYRSDDDTLLTSSVQFYNTITGKKGSFMKFEFNFKDNIGEHVLNFTYSQTDETFYVYSSIINESQNREYQLKEYNRSGKLQAAYNLTELTAEINQTRVYDMKVENKILFLRNFSNQSIFVDLKSSQPQILLSNLVNDNCFSSAFVSDINAFSDFFLNKIYDDDGSVCYEIVSLNRDTAEIKRYTQKELGISENIDLIYIDENDILIQVSKNNAEHFYYGTLYNGEITKLHPLTLEDLSYSSLSKP